MPDITCDELSRRHLAVREGEKPTTEHVIAGCLQRIANSLEKIANEPRVIGDVVQVIPDEAPGVQIVDGKTEIEVKAWKTSVEPPPTNPHATALKEAVANKVTDLAKCIPGKSSPAQEKALGQLLRDLMLRVEWSASVNQEHLEAGRNFLDCLDWGDISTEGWPASMKKSFTALKGHWAESHKPEGATE